MKGLFSEIARRYISRTVRNSLRRPSSTLKRTVARIEWRLGRAGKFIFPDGQLIRCHPICIGEFRNFINDSEQRDEYISFHEHVSSKMVLFDIGCHWGVFSISAAMHAGKDSLIVAVDPSLAALRTFSTNLNLNSIEAQVKIINAACGSSLGKLPMLTTGAGGADYLVIPSQPRPDTIDVQMTTVDSLCEQLVTYPTHLKIDVEGFEEEVLLGASHTLSQFHPIIFLELHCSLIRARGQNPISVLQFLHTLGYKSFKHVTGSQFSFDSIPTISTVRLIASY